LKSSSKLSIPIIRQKTLKKIYSKNAFAPPQLLDRRVIDKTRKEEEKKAKANKFCVFSTKINECEKSAFESNTKK